MGQKRGFLRAAPGPPNHSNILKSLDVYTVLFVDKFGDNLWIKVWARNNKPPRRRVKTFGKGAGWINGKTASRPFSGRSRGIGFTLIFGHGQRLARFLLRAGAHVVI